MLRRQARKGNFVTRQLRRRGIARGSLLGATAALILVCSFGSTLATGADGPDATSVAGTATVTMKADKKGIRFVSPKSVAVGSILRVVNASDPQKVGPHTFSLVTKSSLPKTSKARKLCFAKGHICRSIAQWHGVKGNGPVKVNPAEAGLEGWDTSGSVTTKGDSWFSGNKKGTSFEQPVSLDVSGGSQRIYYLCAIHPWMQGSTEVVPPVATPTG
jgi:hypothetical protein